MPQSIISVAYIIASVINVVVVVVVVVVVDDDDDDDYKCENFFTCLVYKVGFNICKFKFEAKKGCSQSTLSLFIQGGTEVLS